MLLSTRTEYVLMVLCWWKRHWWIFKISCVDFLLIFFDVAQIPVSDDTDFMDFNHSQVSSLSENWKKVNNDPVCFGARGDSYGAFNIIESGLIYTFKLAHLNGNIRCSEDVAASHWGCTHESYGDKQLGTIITFKNKTALQLAEYRGDGIGCAYYSYKLDGVGVNAPILAFNNMSSPLAVSAGQEFRIWFGGDLHNCGESNNSGQTCVDVFAWYAWIGVLHR